MKKISSLFLALTMAILFCVPALAGPLAIGNVGQINDVVIIFTTPTPPAVHLVAPSSLPINGKIATIYTPVGLSVLGAVLYTEYSIPYFYSTDGATWHACVLGGNNNDTHHFNIGQTFLFSTDANGNNIVLEIHISALPPPSTKSSGGTSGSDSSASEHNVASYQKAIIGNCKEWVNVRSGPGLEYDIIGKAYLEEVIELLQWNKDETWCKVIYNNGNNAGWMRGTFIIPLK